MAGQPEIMEYLHIIGDADRFRTFMTDLRNMLANREVPPQPLDVLNGCAHRERYRLYGAHPVLRPQRTGEPAGWIRIELRVEGEGGNELSTALVMRDDNLYVLGFRGQSNRWYALTHGGDRNMLPPDIHNPEYLGWGVEYSTIINAGSNWENYLTSNTALGRASARRAVGLLSSFRRDQDPFPTRLHLGRLIMMICESARINHYHAVVSGEWDNGRGVHSALLGHRIYWGKLSHHLLLWKQNGHGAWPRDMELEMCTKMKKAQQALSFVHLVLNWTQSPLRDVSAQSGGQGQENDNNERDAHGHEDANSQGGGQGQGDANGQGGGHGQEDANGKGPGHGQGDVNGKGTGQGSVDDKAQDLDPAGLCMLANIDVMQCGRALVEILAVRVDSGVVVKTITVFDGIHGHIIYRRGEQREEDDVELDEEGMVALVLTGPYTGISACGNFAIKVDIQTEEGGEVGSSSSADAGGTIYWEWDCYKQEYAAEVEDRKPVTRNISTDPHRKVLVTYLVMSDALEATVQVKLRFKDDPEKDGDLPQELEDEDLPAAKEERDKRYAVNGKIAAHIDDFQDHRIVLFSSAPKRSVPIPRSWILPLARSVIAMPYGKPLHIEVADLRIIDTSTGEVVKRSKFNLSFDCGGLNPTDEVDDDEVEVNVTWDTEQEEIEKEFHKVECIIGDKNEFTTFINNLRSMLTNQPHPEDVLESYRGKEVSSTRNHPVLARPRVKQPTRWIHIELQVPGEETSRTTLAVRDDNLYVMGFMNQSGVWYDLGNPYGAKMLPPEYESILLGWGITYTSILNVRNKKAVLEKLHSVRLGKVFATAAVHTLSRYPDVEDGEDPRLALVGLLIMVCETAKLNPLQRHFEDGWETEKEFTPTLMEYIWNWGPISRALLTWKEEGYSGWNKESRLKSIGIKRLKDALEVVHLVFHASPDQTEVKYIVGDGKGYTAFINRLRRKLADHPDREDVLTGDKRGVHPVLPRQRRAGEPARWIHIKLQVAGEETSTTLAMRGDNACIVGFMNHRRVWYELGGPPDERMLPQDYNSVFLGWGTNYRSILNVNSNEQAENTLKSMRLGKAFMERAVRSLSLYYPFLVDYDDDNPIRLELAGLIVMICDAARMNPFLMNFAGDNWNKGAGLNPELAVFRRKWGSMSAALLKWKNSYYKEWDKKCDIQSPGHALECVHLLLNSRKVKGSGPAQVEILAASANFPVDCITVIDENKRRHNIYKKENHEYQEKQGEQEMVPLVLNVLRKGISGYKWFDIEVAVESSAGVGGTITRRLDCHKQDGDATDLATHTIILDSWRKIAVTYLVMSNAVKATVEVKLLKGDGHGLPKVGDPEDDGGSKQYTASGEIAARIDCFEQHQIVLFRTAQEKVPSDSLTLSLARSEVMVPRGKDLHVDMVGLHISSSDDSGRKHVPDRKLRFEFGSSSPAPEEAGRVSVGELGDIDVSVTWATQKEKMTEKMEPNIVWTIGDTRSFKQFIHDLRGIFDEADTKSENVLDRYKGKRDLLKFGNHPVLIKPRAEIPERWIHIELQAVEGNETWSTTLAIRDEGFYGVGFMNQCGVWYDLCEFLRHRPVRKMLGPRYNSVSLRWGAELVGLLQVDNWEQAARKLSNARLRREFAKKAVRTLAQYPDVTDDWKEEEVCRNPRLALVGLLTMFLESAKLEPLKKCFAQRWETVAGSELTQRHMNYIRCWVPMSETLLRWKNSDFRSWIPGEHKELLESIGIKHEEESGKEPIEAAEKALQDIRLVYSGRWWDYALRIYDEDYTGFLRRMAISSH
ncbi:hypothetical protein ACP70R_021960 [Stipagrostis hirtigluma subsp. patula]